MCLYIKIERLKTILYNMCLYIKIERLKTIYFLCKKCQHFWSGGGGCCNYMYGNNTMKTCTVIFFIYS